MIQKKYSLPCTDLKVNPPFDEIIVERVAEVILALLETDTKYTISLILPNWTEFKGKDMLLGSSFMYKYENFSKDSISFKNYFIGKIINPCDIIIIYLKN